MKIIPEHFWEILFYDEWKSELEEQLFSKVEKDNVDQYFLAHIERHFSSYEEKFRKQVAKEIKEAIKRDTTVKPGSSSIEERLKSSEDRLQKFEGAFESIESGQKDILSAYEKTGKRIDVISDNYSRIQQKYQEQTELIRRQTELIDKQRQDINELSKLIANLKCQLDTIITNKENTTPGSGAGFVTMPDALEKNVIDYFMVQQTEQVFLPSNYDVINSNLALAADCKELLDAFNKSAIDSKDLFIKVVEKYRNEIEKLRKKLKFSDKDYMSLEATESFAEIVERHLVSILCPAIYEGMKLNLVPYCNVLAALNRYLQKCCFYTGRVNPVVSLSQQGELLETMKIIRKDTENFEEDNKIVEVRMLPYFLNYIDEDKEPERYCIEGQMVVLKFKA